MKMKEIIISMYAAALLFLSGSLRAQVTIGDEKLPEKFSVLEIVSDQNPARPGGLRLPQLDKSQKSTLEGLFKDATAPITTNGLVIYNTSSGCIEYWNSERWISLCEGAAQIDLVEDPDPDGVEAEGGFAETEGTGEDFFMVEDNDPEAPDGPFNFTVTIGNDYAELLEVDEVDGFFSLYFKPNNSTKQRSAIVRVTNIITGRYKDFLFIQQPQTCEGLGLGEAPEIITVPYSSGPDRSISFCSGGAVYLRADTAGIADFGAKDLEQLIWTRNGEEIARGVTSMIIGQEGLYDISMGLVGCNTQDDNAVKITRNSNATAPSPVNIVIVGNNGLVCDETGNSPNGTVKLRARRTASSSGGETVQWFKNGELTAKTGDLIDAEIGTWFAVVSNGGCYSTPSDRVDVSLSPYAGGTPLTLSDGDINLGSGFCAGSTQTFTINGAQPDITYVWYADNQEIGTGAKIQYTLPRVPNGTPIMIRCRATQPGSCAAEASLDRTITSGSIPALPQISGDKMLCNGEADLIIHPAVAGTYTYAWYKDNELIGSASQLHITAGGEYYATVTASGCASPMAHITIPKASSAPPVVTLNTSSDTPNAATIGATMTFTTSLIPGPATDYRWTVANPASEAEIVSGGQPGDVYAVVRFKAAATVTVQVEGFNSCGSTKKAMTVTVTNSCETITAGSVSPGSATSFPTVPQGKDTKLGPVSAVYTGGNTAPRTYQWYSNATNANSGGNLITGATSSTYIVPGTNTVGTSYYYCVVSSASGTCSADEPLSNASSPVYTVTVADIPPPQLNPVDASFTGRICFDIGFSEGVGCGTLKSREKIKADFSNRNSQDIQDNKPGTLSGVQVYTFTRKSGNISNVRFMYNDISGEAIENIVPQGTYTGSGITAPCRVTVYFKPTLNTYLRNKPRKEAVKPELYVLYNGNGEEKSIKLTLNLQDCSCCGARTVSGGWQTFACYNLGVDETLGLDPFSYVVGTQPGDRNNTGGTGADGTLGYLYQWGRTDDGLGNNGYQRRNSGTTSTLAGSIYFPDSINPGTPDFIINGRIPDGQDWSAGGTENNILHRNRWGDGTQQANMPKAANDPCPDGWKVPSQAQWASISSGKNNDVLKPGVHPSGNEWKWTGNGYMVGQSLYLPAAGYRNSRNGGLFSSDEVREKVLAYIYIGKTAIRNPTKDSYKDVIKEDAVVGIKGMYWSSTTVAGKAFVSALRIDQTSIEAGREKAAAANAFSVRCVPDE